jgi:hypothetical protein
MPTASGKDGPTSLVLMPSDDASLDDPEDAKLVTLSRATRQRTGAAEGAAVRDLDGRTYTAATVGLPSLRISALPLAVAMAVSSGATGLEAAAVVTTMRQPAPEDVEAVRDLGGHDVAVFVADPDGSLQRVVRT